MSDLKLDETNEGHSGTEIQAQPDFNQAYIFQVRERINNPPNRDVDGLRGIGIAKGHGVVGWTHSARLDREAHADLDNSSTNKDLPFGSGPAGVVGIGFNSSPVTLDDAGVIGASRLNVGVFGSSEGGSGVRGQAVDPAAGGDGVHGLAQGTGSGVFGHSDHGDGVTGEAPNGNGVHGSAGSGGDGVLGESPTGRGVHGHSDSSDGVAGDSLDGRGVSGTSDKGDGVAGMSGIGVGVSGFSKENHAVFGDNRKSPPPSNIFQGALAGCYGVTLQNRGVSGVVGSEDPSKNNPRQINPFAVGVYGAAAHLRRKRDQSVGIAGLFYGPVWVVGDFFVLGAKSAAVAHADGTHRLLYSMESPESWFEDFGEAELVKGKAEVKLDSDFAALVHLRDYHVFVTSMGDSNGLYVSRRSATGFVIREQKGGASTLKFSYRVVAKRKDIDGKRLAKVALPPISPPSTTSRLRPPSRKRGQA